MKKSLLTLGILATLGSPAFAATPSEDPHIADLEARIKVLEANAEAMRQQADAALAALQATKAEVEELKQGRNAGANEAAAPEPAAAPTGANGNAFNPAMSVILDGQYSHHSLNPDDYVRSGFPLAGDAGPGVQGLSLGESEISLSASIDEKFSGQLTISANSENGQDTFGVEEAFVDATALPAGFTLRAGRFFSDIGYLNSHHAHTDKFSDRPLAYQAFLGGQYGDDGVQVRWVAPTDLYMELGGEVFSGDRYPSGGGGHDGVGVTTLFAHAGGDIGVETSWLAGVSMLRSRTEGAEDGFTGDERLYVADVTWKWAPQGNTKDGGFLVRSEYFVEDRDGQYMDPGNQLPDQAWAGMRRGVYVEGIYRINRTWETGYRYDQLWADDRGPFSSNYDPYRHSLMLTWRNSEFSLVRLQLSKDYPNPADVDTAVTLQIQTALGAHGAHKF
ncbi:MAG: hypothetical protein ABI616_08070 [Pseudomonadota bacterium]